MHSIFKKIHKYFSPKEYLFECFLEFHEEEAGGLGPQIKKIMSLYSKYYGEGHWRMADYELMVLRDDIGFEVKDVEGLQGKDTQAIFNSLPDEVQFEWGFFIFYQGSKLMGLFEVFDNSFYHICSTDMKFMKYIVESGQQHDYRLKGEIGSSGLTFQELLENGPS